MRHRQTALLCSVMTFLFRYLGARSSRRRRHGGVGDTEISSTDEVQKDSSVGALLR
jgi:hypothetical protein